MQLDFDTVSTRSKYSLVLLAVGGIFRIIAEMTQKDWINIMTIATLAAGLIYHIFGIEDRIHNFIKRRRNEKRETKSKKR